MMVWKRYVISPSFIFGSNSLGLYPLGCLLIGSARCFCQFSRQRMLLLAEQICCVNLSVCGCIWFFGETHSLGKEISTSNATSQVIYRLLNLNYLELHFQPSFNGWKWWNSNFSMVKIWNHPTETTMLKWEFQLPGKTYSLMRWHDMGYFFHLSNVQNPKLPSLYTGWLISPKVSGT